MLHKGTLCLQELPDSETGLINRCQNTSLLLLLEQCVMNKDTSYLHRVQNIYDATKELSIIIVKMWNNDDIRNFITKWYRYDNIKKLDSSFVHLSCCMLSLHTRYVLVYHN